MVPTTVGRCGTCRLQQRRWAAAWRCCRESEKVGCDPTQQGPMARSVRDCALFLDISTFQRTSPPAQHLNGPIGKARASDGKGTVGASRLRLRPSRAPSQSRRCLVEGRPKWWRSRGRGTAVAGTVPTLRAMYWASWFKRVPSPSRTVKTLAVASSKGRRSIDDVLTPPDRYFVSQRGGNFRELRRAHVQQLGRCHSPSRTNGRTPLTVPSFHYMDWLRFPVLATVTGLPAVGAGRV